MTFNRKMLGNAGEQKVADWLEKKGYKILDRNVRYKSAEIDLVAIHPDRNAISFVEVRTRKSTRLGHPLETITPKKQAGIRQAANLFLIRNKISRIAIQFDVASIVWDTGEFTFIPNAF